MCNRLVFNHLVCGIMEFKTKGFPHPVISCSSLVVANMMTTGGLHGRWLQGPWDWSRCAQADLDTHVNNNKKSWYLTSMKLGLKCCFNRLLVVKLGVSLWLLLLIDISLRFSQSPTSSFSQSAWGGLFIVFHGTTRYNKYLDTIDLRLYGWHSIYRQVQI
jgi:hypothetical protein